MKTCVITGANGFLGTALTIHLAAQGAQVIAIVKDEDEKIDPSMLRPEVQIVYCTLGNFKALPEIIDRKADVFYHFAWAASAGPGRGDWHLQLDNAAYTCDAVEAAARIGCKKFVMAGTITEQEADIYLRQNLIPSNGINYIYGLAKQTASQMGKLVAADCGIAFVKAIISNVYGVGEQSQRLLISSLRTLLDGHVPAFTSGEQPYDFIYISDTAEAFALLGQKGQGGEEYYIGNPVPRPLKDFLAALRDRVDPTLSLGIGKIQQEGIKIDYNKYDTDKLARELGFSPKVSFECGIDTLIQWLRDQEEK